MAYPHWPLFDLVIRSPRLELRLAHEEEFASIVDLIDAGIHDPSTMPFTHPWTDDPLPKRQRDNYQHWWGLRANWRPDNWVFDATVFHEGKVIGVQSIFSKNYGALRTVHTGSWIGQAYQGQGFGHEMRAAMLHFAFTGLGANVAISGAFVDNAASLGVSRSLGYSENGRDIVLRRGQADEIVNLRLDRADWEAHSHPECTIEGLEGCLDMFIGPEGED
ncbi:MAG TPA: GNAT family N-acetyltransferase [Acidimicrobiales bacterium]|jgi:RimJ/RimL family protein N-acetyltransferase